MIEKDLEIFIQVDPQKIDILNKIVEAYDNLALITAVNPGEGKLMVRVTPDTKIDTLRLLKHLPFPVNFGD